MDDIWNELREETELEADVTVHNCFIETRYRGARLDSALAELLNISRAQVQKFIKQGRVSCNGQVEMSPSFKLKGGERLTVYEPPLQPALPKPDPTVPLNIIYEDKAILVLNKDRGQVVHPGAGISGGTLVNGLLAHCRDLSGIGGIERPGIVHRLDKDTSGLLVISKSDAAHLSLCEQFASRQVVKYYEAIVHGVPSPRAGLIEQPIGRHPISRQCMAVRAGGRPSKTEYRTCEVFADKYAHLSIHLFTGRTHQIRVHLSWLGCPLVGDLLYKPKANPWQLQGQALHCYYLSFVHPITGEKMAFRADAPPVMQNILQELRGRYANYLTEFHPF
ncbi:MAG: RluA family pseudouridine synthase [Candidatus Bruticola sp.]